MNILNAIRRAKAPSTDKAEPLFDTADAVVAEATTEAPTLDPEQLEKNIQERADKMADGLRAAMADLSEHFTAHGDLSQLAFAHNPTPGAFAANVGDRTGCMWAEYNIETADRFDFPVNKTFAETTAPDMVGAVLSILAGAMVNEMIPALALANTNSTDREARLTGLNNAATILSFVSFVDHALRDFLSANQSEADRRVLPGAVYTRVMISKMAGEVDSAADKIRADFPNNTKATIN